MLPVWAICLLATILQAAPPLDVYARLPQTEMVKLSPSGKRIAVVESSDQRRVIVMEGDKLLRSAALGTQKIRDLIWAGESNLLLNVARKIELNVTLSDSVAETTTMIMLPLDDKPIWALFERDKAIFAGVQGFYGFSGDGPRYGYFTAVSTSALPGIGMVIPDGQPALYRVDLATRETTIVDRPPGNNVRRDWLLSANGEILATLDYQAANGDWSIRNSAEKVLASGRSPDDGVKLISLGRNERSIAYRVRGEDGTRRLFELPLDGGPAVEPLGGEEAGSYISDVRSGELIGFTKEQDVVEDHFFDSQREKVVATVRKSFSGRSAELFDWSQQFDKLLFFTSGSQDAGSWWLVDPAARTASIVASAYPLEAADVGLVKTFRYRAADGLNLTGVLTLPPVGDAKNLPLIVLPHGTPSDRDFPIFHWWAQAFASRGYAVFQPNYRGSEAPSTVPRFADAGEWGRKVQTDISDGVAALASAGIVDQRRACIAGSDHGGYAALAGVTLQQGLYRCAISVGGFGDVDKLLTAQIKRGSVTYKVGGRFKQSFGKNLVGLSPIDQASRADAPILLVHAEGDLVVPFSQSSDMAAALTRAGKPVEFVKLPGEDHWLSRGETRLAMLKAAVAFIEKHNPPDPAPAR
ncbi:prolyl oligopeptidase family serine peptidase [Sphingomonadaceae bacterium G21617-S1]|nr:prolyl oligopeptidase family serine peptidase [Sphingomonadaceae bacterium G21617-S1]